VTLALFINVLIIIIIIIKISPKWSLCLWQRPPITVSHVILPREKLSAWDFGIGGGLRSLSALYLLLLLSAIRYDTKVAVFFMSSYIISRRWQALTGVKFCIMVGGLHIAPGQVFSPFGGRWPQGISKSEIVGP